MNQDQVEVIDSTELAKRLNVPETWVRSRTNAKRTRNPIPHLRFGRYVRFPWGSVELREWIDQTQAAGEDVGSHWRLSTRIRYYAPQNRIHASAERWQVHAR